MKLTATIDGADLAARALALLDPAVHDRVAEVIHEDTELAAVGAKARVHNVSGELASTVRTAYSTDGLVGWLQAGFGSLKRRVKGGNKRSQIAYWLRHYESDPNADAPGVYAMVVEYGDPRRHHAAHPFMIPAVESIKPQHQAKLEAALEQAVQDAGGGS